MNKKRNSKEVDDLERKRLKAIRKQKEAERDNELLEYEDEEYDRYAELASDYLCRHK